MVRLKNTYNKFLVDLPTGYMIFLGKIKQIRY